MTKAQLIELIKEVINEGDIVKFPGSYKKSDSTQSEPSIDKIEKLPFTPGSIVEFDKNTKGWFIMIEGEQIDYQLCEMIKILKQNKFDITPYYARVLKSKFMNDVGCIFFPLTEAVDDKDKFRDLAFTKIYSEWDKMVKKDKAFADSVYFPNYEMGMESDYEGDYIMHDC